MRQYAFAVAALLTMSPAASFGEDAKPTTGFKGLSWSDLQSYCIWNDSIYSVGSFICSSQTTEVQCSRAEPGKGTVWVKTDSKQCLSPR